VIPEHQQIVDALLASIHDKLADGYLRAQRQGQSVDQLVALADEEGVRVVLRDEHARVAALLQDTDAEQRGMLPVVFPLNGKTAMVWLSVTALSSGGDA
jgi:hypothetical protein